ncbi:hypothetical protein BGLA2_930006 [Burkholderia gladioli]|nr:hypothetical protein BGLA2_930006 [Burkholderia gladioli]
MPLSDVARILRRALRHCPVTGLARRMARGVNHPCFEAAFAGAHGSRPVVSVRASSGNSPASLPAPACL